MIKKINPTYTQNRELSWLKFNARVLEEASDESVPLYERLKFLSIFNSNLDEFFMIRVGSLYDLSLENTLKFDNKSFLTPSQQLEKIFAATKILYKKRDALALKLERACKKAGIQRKQPDKLNKTEQKFMETYFKTQIVPLLSPLVINLRHPFPHLLNKNLYIAAVLKEKKVNVLGIIPVPKTLPKLLYLPGRKVKYNKIKYILIEDIILYYAEKIFNLYSVEKKVIISVTRNADISLDDEEFELGEDYLQHMRKSLRKRSRLAAVRLEINGEPSSFITDYLINHLKINKQQLFKCHVPINMSYLLSLDERLTVEQKATLMYPHFKPSLKSAVPIESKIMDYVRQHDLLLHYPYQSFDLFLNFIKEAVYDESVFAMKITIYRIGKRKAKLIQLLSMAAELGKDVTVLMELRARFDEANNINWAEMLQDSGCKVIYGMEGYKVHAKICLIMRRNENRIEYFTQIGTGNYNAQTAKLYTDLSLFTASDNIGLDAVQFFQNMGTDNLHGNYNCLLSAPNSLKSKLIKLINEEKKKALSGQLSHILLKMNSLTDRELIDALSEASQAGVKIKMIIRGICCLKPGIREKTENIKVMSIVGRFLEHSRVFCFGNGKDTKIYISSADWMTRNTEHRVELACPIYDENLKEDIYQGLLIMWRDTIKGRLINSEGNYENFSTKLPLLNSQEYFLQKYHS
ncbi:polyphosphate kinase 1 [Pectinatus sottacetonis]|uniref:polyphosphate kinase 1 n=1 Tax=Pectinatus sottacetonis TaxID=1002795 RepID=UPI0018C69956|nr:polyphosphate kinase 1 [Pectinatus sottacetonis]